MANRPIPTALRVLRGNPGKRPMPKGEPKPKKGVPQRPEWLSDLAKEEWDRIVPDLLAVGMLTIVDRAALSAYCQAHCELEVATKTVDREGRVFEEPIITRQGEIVGYKKRPHPAVAQQRDAFSRVKSFVVEFGLTPASRTRISVPDNKPENRLEEFLKRG